ncbi:Pet127-domain-containing protein [Auriscalpium vulgare]|uniref:Pet127-domain-containing protein n=1 Tax=Auriscalpium vulgare TaxID=40419 RepID=A0ACB8S1X5_9AGAM|nr:Pet127-domain-containing protein [Auriscalpium vulgare]
MHLARRALARHRAYTTGPSFSQALRNLRDGLDADLPPADTQVSEKGLSKRQRKRLRRTEDEAKKRIKLRRILQTGGAREKAQLFADQLGGQSIDVVPEEPDMLLAQDVGRETAPHLPRVLQYTRRVEGVLQPLGRPVLEDLDPPTPQRPIAQLSHGLERVLFNPGVHWLQDPRSRVYNFPTSLQSIPPLKEFAFERLPGFISSSRDEDLWSLAKREGRTFGGSTSSLSGLLSQIYFLISEDKDVDVSTLSRPFQYVATTFTPGQRMPASVVLKHRDGVYAIDSDQKFKPSADKNVLSWMGTLLEKFLTTETTDFAQFMRTTDPQTMLDPDPVREAYRYSKSDKFVMRSQLDCVDPRLPGTGIFDIKTRAAVPIRMDLMNWEENSGYLIRSNHGLLESFEKEYYDLIRSAFLKYSFQVRIGNMDGVFVAYHNTARIAGFQYIPLSEMEARLYGNEDRGDRVFEKCVSLLEILLTEATQQFPGQSLRIMAEKREASKQDPAHAMQIYVEPAEWDESQGPIPVTQFDVTAKSFAGEDEVRGSRAITRAEAPWTLLWSISTSALPQDIIQKNIAGARERQFRAWDLPTGVSLHEMKGKWNAINFSPTASEEPFNPALFRAPGHRVERLRKLARTGAEDTLKAAEADAGREVHVLPPTRYARNVDFEAVRHERELQAAVQAGVSHAFFLIRHHRMNVARNHKRTDANTHRGVDNLALVKLMRAVVQTRGGAAMELVGEYGASIAAQSVDGPALDESTRAAVQEGVDAALQLVEAHRASIALQLVEAHRASIARTVTRD